MLAFVNQPFGPQGGNGSFMDQNIDHLFRPPVFVGTGIQRVWVLLDPLVDLPILFHFKARGDEIPFFLLTYMIFLILL